MKCLKTPETTIYRKINNELVVIQLDSAHFYYFSPEAETIIEFFKTPSTVDDFIEQAELKDKASEEIEPLKEFCQMLLTKHILQESNITSDKSPKRKITYQRPSFLREGEKTLEQISFGSP